MRKKTVRRAELGGNAVADSLPWEVEFAQDLPNVPVMPMPSMRDPPGLSNPPNSSSIAVTSTPEGALMPKSVVKVSRLMSP